MARESGQNHGLVHYYFGSVDELLIQTLERFTARVLERQRAMYATDAPFVEKWRTAMGYIEDDLASGFPKVWAELDALAWNKPELQERLTRVNESWRSLLRDALAQAIEEYGLDESRFTAEALAALVMQFNKGLLYERLLASTAATRSCWPRSTPGSLQLEEGRHDDQCRDHRRARAGRGAEPGPLPRQRGLRRARRACGSSTRSTARVKRRSSCCPPGRWSTPATGRCRSPTSRGTSGCSTMDGLGNGRSDRCRDPRRYRAEEFARDCLAVMDATGTDRAVMASLSRGTQWLLELARLAPERVRRRLHRPPVPRTRRPTASLLHRDDACPGRHSACALRWWGHVNAAALAASDYPEFAEWFISRCFPEPHSTKGIEDGIGWALDTDHETLVATVADGESSTAPRTARAGARASTAPCWSSQATATRSPRPATRRALARLGDGQFEHVPGAGHFPHARKPVQVNLALRDFSEDAFGRERTPRDPTVYRPDGRPRALYISSPIGLGHAQRDVAIARELRRQSPDLQVDWLAQDPVTRVLEGEGERIHPASAHLANESRHIESESAEHDLHCFQALRRMDEILAANFMLFHDVVRDERYDLWIGDEAWELDYYLHENPARSGCRSRG